MRCVFLIVTVLLALGCSSKQPTEDQPGSITKFGNHDSVRPIKRVDQPIDDLG